MALSKAQAKKYAEKLLKLTADAKVIADNKKELQAKLTSYVEETGDTDLGKVMAYQQATPPKLMNVDGTSKIDKAVAAKLILDISEDYLVTKLNVKEMNEQLKIDSKLRRVLRSAKLEIVQHFTWRFKHVS